MFWLAWVGSRRVGSDRLIGVRSVIRSVGWLSRFVDALPLGWLVCLARSALIGLRRVGSDWAGLL